jgi:hypothetical protein
MQKAFSIKGLIASAIILLITLSAAPVDAQESAPEQILIESFLGQSGQAQLGVVARIQADADLSVRPYMDNPVLMFRQEQGIGPGSGFSTSVFGGEFTFDVAGKHNLRKESARVRSGLHRLVVRQQLLLGTCAVREVVLEYELLEARLAISRRFETRYEWLVEMVTSLAKGLEKSRFDVGRTTWRLEVFQERIAELLVERSARMGEISAMVGCLVPDSLHSMLPDSLPDLAELLIQSRSNHPVLSAATVNENTKIVEEKLADRTWIPDLGVYGAYRIDSLDTGKQPLHGYEFGLTIALPVFQKGEDERSQARAATAAARLSLMREWQAIRVRITASHAKALSRLNLLSELSSHSDAQDSEIWDAAVRAYKEDVVVLGELVEMLQIEEARALSRARIRFEARQAVLATYCAAGFFPEQEINYLISGDKQ